jgi:hypothetical protein
MKRGLFLAAFAISLLVSSTEAVASYNVYVCGSWSQTASPFVPAAAAGMEAVPSDCGAAGSAALILARADLRAVPNGQGASWTTTAPAGLTITHIYTANDGSSSVGDGEGWWGEFFWQGGPGVAGRSAQLTDNFGQFGCCQASFNNQTVGWFISCGWASCSSPVDLDVGGVQLTVSETTGPQLAAPSGLWQMPGWVRGDVVLGFYGDSPSGVCGLGATINGQIVASSNSPRNQTTWHQCAAPAVSQTIHTGDYGQGAMPLTISGLDAAGVPINYTKTIRIDNQQPTVALTGPADAASTAGTQHVTATATAGPSGVAGISCAVDGGAASWYPTATAQVPVSGVGQHVVQCFSESNARDRSGSPGVSAMGSFSMSIRIPTISGIAFTAIADRLRCHRVQKRIRVPARTVFVRRHHKRVRIHRPAHTKIVHVTKCHPRTIIKHRIVIVTIHRHGKKVRVRRRKTIHVIVLPHPVLKLKRRVAVGHGTTVSGWLGTYDGTALAGQPVEVLSAPDNGHGAFTPAAWATTAANGGWSAQLRAGPSRLIEATYPGAANLEPSLSDQVTETVPAKVMLVSITPRKVAWGGTVRLRGKLVGGYLPASGALVRLRIGVGSTQTTYGVKEHVTGSGHFSTTYTFGLGDPRAHQTFWFQFASLPIGDYPYAPAHSGRLTVRVGGHPVTRHRHHPHHRRVKHQDHGRPSKTKA